MESQRGERVSLLVVALTALTAGIATIALVALVLAATVDATTDEDTAVDLSLAASRPVSLELVLQRDGAAVEVGLLILPLLHHVGFVAFRHGFLLTPWLVGIREQRSALGAESRDRGG